MGNHDSRNVVLDELLETWERRRAQGEELSAQELCSPAHEELVPEVARRIDNKKILEQLVEEWEVQVDSGRDPKVEEICSDHPELLADFRAEVAALERFDNLFGAAGGSPLSVADVREFCDGRYEVQEVFSSGGLGVLYNAVDRELDRAILVKTMLPRLSSVPDSRQHFEREARITGQLEHPGIVPVYGFGRDSEGRPYYAMKFVRGETLREAIRHFHEVAADDSERTLEFQKLLRSFVAVCQTVAFAHSRQIIHRDLKPQNIMLGKYGEVLVIDWGLAKSTAEKDQEPSAARASAMLAGLAPFRSQTAVKGTPSYMSPEQATLRKELIGPASDIFSLGATLFEILTGRGPFSGRSSPEVLAQVTSGTIPRPTAINRQVPRALEAICLKAMRSNPADRYGDAQQFAQDVERYLADEPVSAWEEPWIDRLRRTMRHHRTLSTGVGVAAAVALVSISVAAALLAAKDRKLAVANHELAAQNQQLREAGYVSNFLVAKAEWERGRPEVARGILDQTDPDLRGPEWSALQPEIEPIEAFGITSRGAVAKATGLASIVPTMTHLDMTNDGAFVAAASFGVLPQPGQAKQDWVIDVHDVRATAHLYQLGGSGYVWSLRFSKDGQRLGAIVGPHVASGNAIQSALAKALAKSASTQPRPHITDRYRKLLRDNSRPARAEEKRRAEATAIKPESEPNTTKTQQPVATAKDELPPGAVFKVWDVKTGKELDAGGLQSFQESFGVLKSTFLRGAQKDAPVKAESADGRLSATVDADGLIRVRSTATRRPVAQVSPVTGRVWALRFDAGAKHILWVEDDEVLRKKTLPLQPQKLSSKSPSAAGESLAIAAVPGGELLVSVHKDGFVRIWDIAARREMKEFRFASTPIHSARESFALSPDGSWLAAFEPAGARILEVSTGREIYRLPNVGPPIAFSPDAAWFVAIQHPPSEASAPSPSDQGSVRQPAAKPAKSETSRTGMQPAGEVGYKSLTKDDLAGALKRMEADEREAAQSGFLIVETKTGRARLLRHDVRRNLPRDLAVGPRGDQFAELLWDGKRVWFWDPLTGSTVSQSIEQWYGNSPATRLFYAPTGWTLVTVDQTDAHLWDVKNWRATATLQGHRDSITDVQFLTDGKRIATASADGRIGLWDEKTGFPLWFFQDADGRPVSCVRQIGGKLIGGSDAILIWPGETR
jgi:WD40 repeat protein